MWGSAERKLFLLYSSGSVQDVYSVGQFGLYWRQSRAKKQRWTKSKWNKWGNSSALGCNPVASPPTQPSKLPIMQGAASAACIVVNNNYILNTCPQNRVQKCQNISSPSLGITYGTREPKAGTPSQCSKDCGRCWHDSSCTSMMQISQSTTSRRCCTGLRSGDCVGHLSQQQHSGRLWCSNNAHWWLCDGWFIGWLDINMALII